MVPFTLFSLGLVQMQEIKLLTAAIAPCASRVCLGVGGWGVLIKKN